MSSLFPILLSVVFSSILGMLWYSDSFFGIPWKRAMNINEKDTYAMKIGSPRAIAGNLFMTILTMIGLWIFLLAMTAYKPTMEQGLSLGAMVGATAWLFFVVPTMMQTLFFESRSWLVTQVNLGYRFVELVGGGMIMTFWLK